ncbi:SH3 and multiple ankyrin repeat domains protein 2 [Orbilia blumenaviensis]|uniref:SH3 and multiple ankyrin repeat domains protein 2 n=1 Tax=Orbilia blumenaviensis TaxID=1796055 RepID=A0AAV9TZC6_9PEZI
MFAYSWFMNLRGSLHDGGTKAKLTHSAYTIGLVYVKPLELDAIIPMLDEQHESLPLHEEDQNEYILGRIGQHNVIVVGPPRGTQGKATMASTVSQIRFTFRNVRIGLLVGIGGGVPQPGHDIRLGDVVVGAPEYGPPVVQYDLGKQTLTGIEVSRTLNKPPTILLNVVNKINSESRHDLFLKDHLRRFEVNQRMKNTYSRPDLPDRLFKANYSHPEDSKCEEHDTQYLIERRDRDPGSGAIYIHYGTILSGDSVMKNGQKRDELSKKYNNALCFEMEAAGVMDVFPCLVIRGICDYCDSHKSREWQSYAAATAAAYAREVLCTLAERVRELELQSTSVRDVGEHTATITAPKKNERDEFLKMLSFPEMKVRERTVERAYSRTYEWVRTSKQYTQWKSSKNGKLLIKGKAGCGKSTLIKHLYSAEMSSGAHPIVCAFFFNNRGSPFERSVEAMLRTLIHQIVSQSPVVFKSLRGYYSDMEATWEEGVGVDWTKCQLEDMFQITVRLPSVTGLIYIDALDEGEGFIPSETFAFLEESLMGGSSRYPFKGLRICLSSRPDNFINHRTNWTTIDLGEGNSEDIAIYITEKLQRTAKMCSSPYINYSDIIPEACERVLQKADGVFLWAKLVLEGLQKAMNRSVSEDELFDILGGFPNGLYDLFASCLRRVDESDRLKMKHILQIVLAAERPLRVGELLDFIKTNSYGANPQTQLKAVSEKGKQSGRAVTIHAVEEEYQWMEIQIQNWSGGLVEVVHWRPVNPREIYSGGGLVQFMHQSVKEFFQEPSISGQNFHGFTLREIQATAHELMFLWSIHYLRNLEDTGFFKSEAPIKRRKPKDLNELSGWRQFVFYLPFWVLHAEKAASGGCGLSVDDLYRASEIFTGWDRSLHRDYMHSWHNCLYCDLRQRHLRCRVPRFSLLVFTAFNGFVSLVKALLLHSNPGIEQRVLDSALIVACYSNPIALNNPQGDPSTGGRIIDLLIGGGANVDACQPNTTPLAVACKSGNITTVELLLSRGAQPNTLAVGGRFALAEAAARGDIEIIKLLIEHGAITDIPQSCGKTVSPLAIAAEEGHKEAVELLVANGADVNREYDGVTPLIAASRCDKDIGKDIMEYLIENGAIVDLLPINHVGSAGSALIAVLSPAGMFLSGNYDPLERVKLLLRKGADVNLVPRSGRYGTALIAAAALSDTNEFRMQSKLSIMRYLIEHGALVNKETEVGVHETALIASAYRASYEGMKLLIENGADVNLPVQAAEDRTSALAAITGDGNDYWWTDIKPKERQKAIRLLVDSGAQVD